MPNFSSHSFRWRYKDKGTYKQRFIGYKFRHTLKVEFESDNERLGKVLYALANSPVRPEFRLSYTVKDPEAVKNALLGKAVTDAKEKGFCADKGCGHYAERHSNDRLFLGRKRF